MLLCCWHWPLPTSWLLAANSGAHARRFEFVSRHLTRHEFHTTNTCALTLTLFVSNRSEAAPSRLVSLRHFSLCLLALATQLTVLPPRASLVWHSSARPQRIGNRSCINSHRHFCTVSLVRSLPCLPCTRTIHTDRYIHLHHFIAPSLPTTPSHPRTLPPPLLGP